MDKTESERMVPMQNPNSLGAAVSAFRVHPDESVLAWEGTGQNGIPPTSAGQVQRGLCAQARRGTFTTGDINRGIKHGEAKRVGNHVVNENG